VEDPRYVEALHVVRVFFFRVAQCCHDHRPDGGAGKEAGGGTVLRRASFLANSPALRLAHISLTCE
jgi:hypothetical protein